jgi:NADH:ubiquinone oxidoreductase subunit 4 (subunit M)
VSVVASIASRPSTSISDCWNDLALEGSVMQMLCHGLSTGGLFVIVGFLDERIHRRELGRMGGFWTTAPIMGGMASWTAQQKSSARARTTV